MNTMMKVGELARRTGLTVRTLHHYDDVGLLRPAARTPAGHRLYGEGEVERLQQIASLRRLGLSLDDVAACLQRPQFTLARVLDLHVMRLREHLARQERLVALLEGLRSRIAEGGSASLDELVRTVEATLRLERYYTPAQLEALEKRSRQVGPEGMEEAQRAWARVFDGFAAAMREGRDVADPSVRALAEEARALVAAFTGGDAGIHEGLGRLMEAEGEGVLREHGMALPEGLWEYMARARRVLEEGSGTGLEDGTPSPP